VQSPCSMPATAERMQKTGMMEANFDASLRAGNSAR
jgi:hypothetical protein